MGVLNYFQRAQQDMQRFAGNDRLGAEWEFDRTMAKVLAGLIDHGVKFDLPERGRIFDDDLRGIRGEKIRLPAPVVCLEYHVTRSRLRLATAWERTQARGSTFAAVTFAASRQGPKAKRSARFG